MADGGYTESKAWSPESYMTRGSIISNTGQISLFTFHEFAVLFTGFQISLPKPDLFPFVQSISKFPDHLKIIGFNPFLICSLDPTSIPS